METILVTWILQCTPRVVVVSQVKSVEFSDELSHLAFFSMGGKAHSDLRLVDTHVHSTILYRGDRQAVSFS